MEQKDSTNFELKNQLADNLDHCKIGGGKVFLSFTSLFLYLTTISCMLLLG